jgi:flagellar protein FlaG
MNTISSSTIGQTMAMDGRSYYSAPAVKQKTTVDLPDTGRLPSSSAEVAQTIEQNLAQVKESVAQLQKLSDLTVGHKLQFNVNNELGEVIVKVVDPKTNQVIKEIPSEDVQNMQIRMKKVLGLLFDEMI